jgi:mannose-6-phosphate isomerase-like protein (cupin superfamily)
MSRDGSDRAGGPQAIIALPSDAEGARYERFSAVGASFSLQEWRGSGPGALHVHHADDEAWHVLEGSLHFRFVDREVDVGAGGSVFVPAGVPHTYTASNARYLIVLTPRLAKLIADLQQAKDPTAHPAIYRRYDSTLLESR